MRIIVPFLLTCRNSVRLQFVELTFANKYAQSCWFVMLFPASAWSVTDFDRNKN